MTRAAIVGASGYAGGELLRLLHGHPEFELGSAMAASNAGAPITALHPNLASFSGRAFDAIDIDSLNGHDLVFLALPHGESAAVVARLTPEVKVVDLGADFRLRSSVAWDTFYGGSHAGSWVYGLSEWNRAAISQATRVANPGCYAGAIELGILPVASLLESETIVVVAASGTTGAGRAAKANLIASEVMGNMTPYKVGGVHQHTPEIEESIAAFAGVDAKILFTPILAPMPRGIIATITAKTKASESDLRARIGQAYAASAFVSLLGEGLQPSTASTLGSNAVQIQCVVDARTQHVVITVALDNLVKGAAGQAIQNANLMSGFPEASGLSVDGVAP